MPGTTELVGAEGRFELRHLDVSVFPPNNRPLCRTSGELCQRPALQLWMDQKSTAKATMQTKINSKVYIVHKIKTDPSLRSCVGLQVPTPEGMSKRALQGNVVGCVYSAANVRSPEGHLWHTHFSILACCMKHALVCVSILRAWAFLSGGGSLWLLN